jgi:transposase
LYFEDESRFGLFTRAGKSLTVKGVKPKCKFQQVFKSTHLFGAFSPLTGDYFVKNLGKCTADIFQIYLNEFSLQRPNELKVIVLDNGAFHKARKMIIPKNILLVFLPAYSPELNPAEHIWWSFKRAFSNKIFDTMDDLNYFLFGLSNSKSNETIKSETNYTYINTCSFGAELYR